MKGSRLKVKSLKFKKLWIGIGILILLSPIGIILPELFKAGGAWGEWGLDELKDIVGYIPEGLKKLSELWRSPIPDYSFHGWGGIFKSPIAYIISGIIGVVLVILLAFIIVKLLVRKDGNS